MNVNFRALLDCNTLLICVKMFLPFIISMEAKKRQNEKKMYYVI